MISPLLEIRSLKVSYGAIAAIRDCTLHVDRGEVVAIVGANGAGKTTLLRSISNILTRAGGDIVLNGRSTQGIAPHSIARMGITHVPEGRGVIGRLSVLDNLKIAYQMRPTNLGFNRALDRTFERFPRMRERSNQSAGLMSGGEQQMLALARALVNPPQLLLVDEPSLGLSPRMVGEAFQALKQFACDGMTILLVEQNTHKALKFANRGYVMAQGLIGKSGMGAELLQEDVFKYYLGNKN
jgi:branched-chain amino acid transport system ATP-binding protein